MEFGGRKRGRQDAGWNGAPKRPTDDEVFNKYKRAKTNLQILRSFGAQLLHGVDAIKMKLHPDLQMRKFDRIVYNFPHAGFLGKEDDHRVIMKHRIKRWK